jgi:hypothetical protein
MSLFLFRYRIKRFSQRVLLVIKYIAAYLAFVSVFQFSNFILEEAIQTTIFGSWQAKDNPRLTKVAVKLIESINANLKFVNNVGGWLNPLGWLAYREYHSATAYWVLATKHRILAQDPEVMEGEELAVTFTPETRENLADGVVLRAGKIRMILPPGAEPPTESTPVRVVREGKEIVLRPKEE